MRILPTIIAGLLEIEGRAHHDERGFFLRTWCREEFLAAGIDFSPVQTSVSASIHRHTLRGMHYQVAPARERKLVRCLHGRIFDVVVDLRQGSPTRLQHWAVILSFDAGNALVIPEGCAHGFMTLTDGALVEYMMDAPHAPEHARGLRWDDPALGLPWPARPVVISARDRNWPDHV
ncbi:MAG: dTDP-4-dehydrorhamnose 3,5-epimerase family protein [Desulfomicrobium sp.]|nr:dTDP-4-dehydrorhamnose 3,5-epimerase family protein [Pseudomonadota bacterium]MBV1711561.1 dTDP-4-dehydrorhamnose 3,5-epimerase family protein [Desulfomicrobium sp.]MBU4572974.1 dTDP-4-dehydrorhamnose 3,5-epimerase family protein [Pseudomonadota bacterium]MBU4594702.1 dTDP-4-dehydrorhamnose 3,5-epimerase family protein [Pseudomonadota bacterium]MBV1718838.1 dTDP-4-dehydrorhamnose 3,5-epimerase family protein [Desulfomicrobium sp.]